MIDQIRDSAFSAKIYSKTYQLLIEMIKEIIITDHIVERYIQRFNPQLSSIQDYNARLIAAKRAINVILKDAQYISDSENGVLLESKTFKCRIIVHDRILITIYETNKSKKGKRNSDVCNN
jgi:hypothetical protein